MPGEVGSPSLHDSVTETSKKIGSLNVCNYAYKVINPYVQYRILCVVFNFYEVIIMTCMKLTKIVRLFTCNWNRMDSNLDSSGFGFGFEWNRIRIRNRGFWNREIRIRNRIRDF